MSPLRSVLPLADGGDRLIAFFAIVRVVQAGGAGREPLQAVLGALAGVDVVNHHLRQDVPGLARGAGEPDDLGILQRERAELLDDRLADDQALALPEVLVFHENVSEGPQKGRPHAGGAGLEGPLTDFKGLVDGVEERPDVALEPAALHGGVGLVQRVDQLVKDGGPPRTEPGVDEPGRLEEQRGRHQLRADHPLRPAHAPEQDRGALFHREVVEGADGRALVAHVAEQDVGRQLGAVEVERLEALALPRLRGVEVDDAAEPRVGRALVTDDLAGGDPLEAVDDVGRILEQDAAVGQGLKVAAAHAQLDIGQGFAGDEDLGQLVDLAFGQDLALVVGDAQVVEGRRVDHPTKDDLPVRPLVERGVGDVNVRMFGHVALPSLNRELACCLHPWTWAT